MADEMANILAELRRLNALLEARLPAPPEPIKLPQGLAFRWLGKSSPRPFEVIESPKPVQLDDLIGIDHQKQTLDRNTRQFLAGYPANNVLLWGSRGTGKSSLIRALLHAYGSQGLRIIEVSRANLKDLPVIQSALGGRSEHFIVYCDDLAFEADDQDYKALKAILEGSLEGQPENLLIYATSNRRHLLPEHHQDNQAARWVNDELHQGESVEEKLSLSERFGIWLSFIPFTQDQYLAIVAYWLGRLGNLALSEQARTEALAYALLRGSRSGRVARQFAMDFAGRQQLETT